MDRIRVLVVDDSAFMRHALTRLLGESPAIEVVGAAADGEQGVRLAAELSPDVVTLDVEMPVLDGLGMLTRLMHEHPARVVMLSSVTSEGAQVTLDALDLGAIDFVTKPSGSLSIDIGRVGADLVAKIQAAAGMSDARFLRHRQIAALNAAARATRLRSAQTPKADPAVNLPPPSTVERPARPARDRTAASVALRVAARKLVVVASSTGGPGALNTLVRGLPERLGAAVVLVQHMPPGFTASLAERLDSICALPVTEAAAEDVLAENEVLLAPGDRHLICSTTGHVQLVGLPPVNGVRPAADVTLQAVAPLYRNRLLCVVLTGMGCDARDGARTAKVHGATVFAQDEATSTIYGMPAAVAEAGLTDRILPLPEMAAAIAEWCALGVADVPRARDAAPAAAGASLDRTPRPDAGPPGAGTSLAGTPRAATAASTTSFATTPRPAPAHAALETADT